MGKQKGLYQSLPRKDEKEMYFQVGGYIYLFMDLYHWPTLIVRFFVIYKDHTCTSIVLLNIAPLNILNNNMTNNIKTTTTHLLGTLLKGWGEKQVLTNHILEGLLGSLTFRFKPQSTDL